MDQAANLRKLAKENTSRIPQKPRNKQKGMRIIAITSGKGGVGKSSLSVNLALSLAKSGLKVLVFDADLGMANINVILGIIPKFNLYHVVKGQKKLKDIIISAAPNLDIIAGASGYHQLANLDREGRERFIAEMRSIGEYDIMIIDTGAGASDNVVGFIVPAGEVVVVTTPEPTSITDAYGIIKAIVSQAGDKNFKLLVNRAKTALEARRVAERVINISGQFLNVKVENIGFVYDDESVGKSVRAQKPFSIAYPRCKASVCVENLSARLLNIDIDIDENAGIGGFFKKIFAAADEKKQEV